MIQGSRPRPAFRVAATRLHSTARDAHSPAADAPHHAHTFPALPSPRGLRAGHPDVKAEPVAEREERFDISVHDGVGWTDAGRMVARTAVATVDGRDALVWTLRARFRDEPEQVDSVVLDRRTRAPVLARLSAGESSQRLDFAERRVRRVRDSRWGTDTADVELPEPVFLAGVVEPLLAALPLADGYEADAAVYSAVDGPQTRHLTAAAEELRLPSGTRVAVWRVQVWRDEVHDTYWMDRESRTLVQYESAGTLRLTRAEGTP
jgi:hypothetical protein